MGMPIGQKIDGEAPRDRRLAARKLLDEGVAQAEVARRLKVSRQSVSRWADAPAKRLEAICRFGRKSTIDERLLGRLRQALLAGAKRQGIAADVWTLPRVQNLIVKLGGPSFSTVHVWRLLGGWASVHSGRQAEPGNATRRPSPPGEPRNGPGLKNPLSERRTIVLIDKSGLSEQPHRVRTWAPIASARRPSSSSASIGRSCRPSPTSPAAPSASVCTGEPSAPPRLSPSSASSGASARQASHHLGQDPDPPQPAGTPVYGNSSRASRHDLPAGIRPRTQCVFAGLFGVLRRGRNQKMP